MTTILRYPKGYQFLDNNGQPLANGTLSYFQAGTATPLVTFSDSAGTQPNSNPIALDSSGRLDGYVYLDEQANYKEVLETSAAAVVSPWPDDNISGQTALGSVLSSFPVLISSPVTYAINPNGSGDYGTLQAAFADLATKVINTDAAFPGVTLALGVGTFAYTTPVETQNPFTKVVFIKGATPVSANVTSVQNSSGSAGAWTFTLNLDTVNGISVGNYVVIKNASGGSYPEMLEGCWPITAIDAVNHQITITSTHRFPVAPSGSVSATAVALQSILKFTGCGGITIYSGGTAINIQDVAIVGDGSATYHGIDCEDVGRCYISGHVGVYGFGGPNVFANYNSEVNGTGTIASSGSASYGVWADTGACYDLPGIIANGNGSHGQYTTSCASIRAQAAATSSGNAGHGFYSQDGSNIYLTESKSTGNGGWGYIAANNGSLNLVNPTGGYNTSGDYNFVAYNGAKLLLKSTNGGIQFGGTGTSNVGLFGKSDGTAVQCLTANQSAYARFECNNLYSSGNGAYLYTTGYVNATTYYSIGGVQVLTARISGYGTPQNGSRIANFDANTATLSQTAQLLAQLIVDLKTHGLIGL